MAQIAEWSLCQILLQWQSRAMQYGDELNDASQIHKEAMSIEQNNIEMRLTVTLVQ